MGYTPREINRLVLAFGAVPLVLGYLLAIPATLSSMEQMLKNATQGVDIALPVQVSPWYLLLGFLIIFLTYQLAKLLSRRKVLTVSMTKV